MLVHIDLGWPSSGGPRSVSSRGSSRGRARSGSSVSVTGSSRKAPKYEWSAEAAQAKADEWEGEMKGYNFDRNKKARDYKAGRLAKGQNELPPGCRVKVPDKTKCKIGEKWTPQSGSLEADVLGTDGNTKPRWTAMSSRIRDIGKTLFDPNAQWDGFQKHALTAIRRAEYEMEELCVAEESWTAAVMFRTRTIKPDATLAKTEPGDDEDLPGDNPDSYATPSRSSSVSRRRYEEEQEEGDRGGGRAGGGGGGQVSHCTQVNVSQC